MCGRRGRKPVSKGLYDALVPRLNAACVKPPSFKAYQRTPEHAKKTIDKLLNALENSGNNMLPSNFRIVGEWVTCEVPPYGKTLLVRRKALRLVREAG